MQLIHKIKSLYPELTDDDFIQVIELIDRLDGKGACVDQWNHPTLPEPTAEQLAALEVTP